MSASSGDANNSCLTLPPKINSLGFSVPGYIHDNVLQYALPQLEVQVVLIFFLTQVFHWGLKHVGVTCFVSQLLVSNLPLHLLCSLWRKAPQRSLWFVVRLGS